MWGRIEKICVTQHVVAILTSLDNGLAAVLGSVYVPPGLSADRIAQVYERIECWLAEAPAEVVSLGGDWNTELQAGAAGTTGSRAPWRCRLMADLMQRIGVAAVVERGVEGFATCWGRCPGERDSAIDHILFLGMAASSELAVVRSMSDPAAIAASYVLHSCSPQCTCVARRSYTARSARSPDWSKVDLEVLDSEIAKRLARGDSHEVQGAAICDRVAEFLAAVVPKLPTSPAPKSDSQWAVIGELLCARNAMPKGQERRGRSKAICKAWRRLRGKLANLKLKCNRAQGPRLKRQVQLLDADGT